MDRESVIRMALRGGWIIVFVVFIYGTIFLYEKGNEQLKRTAQAFRAECEAINGRAVWNNKYWECLK